MGILIGMDEAGYGPNLGPLVVAATAWEVSGEDRGSRSEHSPRLRRRGSGSGQATAAPALLPEVGEVDLYELLGDFITDSPAADRLAIADSKALYRPGLGLSSLERGVHAVLAVLGRRSACWSTLVDTLSADPHGGRHSLPWHADFSCDLPLDAAADELTSLGARLAETCAAADARPVALRARLVFPAEFNELTVRYGTKGAALSHITIGLLQQILGLLSPESFPTAEAASPAVSPQDPGPSPQPPVFIVCDKHGGRNRYHGLLQHFFPDQWIETLVESRAESRYHWDAADGRVDVAFRRRGESFLPAALASMTAKYLRELAMRALNEFWRAHVPGLRPTAGYPLDARRFKAEIQNVQRSLRIDDHILWRNR